MRTIFVFLKIFQPTYNKVKIGRLISWCVEPGEVITRSVIECTVDPEAAFYLHAAMKSELLKCQNTDNPLTRMKIVDLPTTLLSFHEVERRMHTKRQHTSQHRAGIQNGNHHAKHVAQYPEFSTHSLGKMSMTQPQARTTRDTLQNRR
jgi:hypothetical protein